MKTSELIKGIHHVTATVDDAQEDYDFYTQLLGLRLVKKTVNFENNRVYHFYYGDEHGHPGTIMTTFPYKGEGVRQGSIGTGQVKITSFLAPKDSILFWQNRLIEAGVTVNAQTRFGENLLQFKDPSGLLLEIIGNDEDNRKPWENGDISLIHGIRGLHTVVLSIAEVKSTFDFLTDEFGFKKVAEEGSFTRFAVGSGGPGQYVDISDDGGEQAGRGGIGTVHHVAWRVENDEALLAIRQHLVEQLAFKVTEVKDRNYFHSIYFRMPGRVLFEIASIPPGFEVDEPLDTLGAELKLPSWEEMNRTEIENHLPTIQ